MKNKASTTKPSSGPNAQKFPDLPAINLRAATDYATDFWQRTAMFFDILRQSGNQQEEMTSRPVNAVLIFDHEIILKGTELSRPVNYALVRVEPPPGTAIDETKRPVVVIDPRAGQGPGIGGFKPTSEIGEAFKAGHPVYFIGFTVDPLEGQTIEDVAMAHTIFLQKVIDLHPRAEGKPMLIGNCQAGWHALMAACIRPDLTGPVVLAGAPVSYWGGVRGQNPMRYSGGLFGGTWMARLISDLGGGIFDGAWLISNFDSLNPANTYWTKPYNVWSQPEKEQDRYLGFEKWWGAFVRLRGEELQYMVDNLFVGNKFSTGQMVTKDGIRLDIRNVKSPILCFCSKGDDITPPQQALDWVLDNYDNVDEMRRHGQTILYCLHEKAGHLAIFVGTKVAAKEHSEFINYMDLIDGIPPGLYEIVITDKGEGEVGAELLKGAFNVKIEERGIEDIIAMGCNSNEDEREFDTVARVSALNNALYSAFVQPWLQASVTPQLASAVLASQPLRLQYAMFSDKNPMMRFVPQLAEKARAERKAAAPDNPYVKMQEQVSNGVTEALEALGRVRDQTQEAIFHAVYGSPWLQAWLGTPPKGTRPRPKPGVSPIEQAAIAQRIEHLRATMDKGGPLEAIVRALVYIAKGQKSVDARSFEVLRRILKEHPEITLARYKAVVRQQWAMLTIDEVAALRALPKLLPADATKRRAMFEGIRHIRTAAGELEGEAKRRLEEVRRIFDIEARPAAAPPKARRVPRKPQQRRRAATTWHQPARGGVKSANGSSTAAQGGGKERGRDKKKRLQQESHMAA
jgi:pimeloyl-ACP methyl ester carboxylesterase